MSTKYTLTYEYQDGDKKVASVYVVENATNILDVLDSVQNFLSSTGFRFDSNQYLAVVENEGVEQNASENGNEETR